MWPFTSKAPGEEENDKLIRAAKQARINNTSDAIFVPPGAEPDSGILELMTGYPSERLGMPLKIRMPLLLVSSFGTGFLLGAARGGPKAADRYRAENAHRMPVTKNGWYLYYKSKQYHAIVGGVFTGVRMGAVLSGWASLFMATEEIVDRARERMFASEGPHGEILATGQRDAASTIVAAMSTAGLYSWKNGLDSFTAARTAKTALKISLVWGLAQDALATIKGSSPAYVDRIVGVMTGRGQEQGDYVD